ncbi:MAG TPA: hypothetical protein VF614_14065 [Chthoniobacteraceae bacterium]|jgi:hypothetical protein
MIQISVILKDRSGLENAELVKTAIAKTGLEIEVLTRATPESPSDVAVEVTIDPKVEPSLLNGSGEKLLEVVYAATRKGDAHLYLHLTRGKKKKELTLLREDKDQNTKAVNDALSELTVKNAGG